MAHASDADLVCDDTIIVRESLLKLGEPELWSMLRNQGMKLSAPRRLTLLEFVRHDLGMMKPLIRSSFLERHRLGYDPALRYGEDFALYFEALAVGGRWVQLPDGYYLYRKHPDAVSTDKHALWQNVVDSARGLVRHPVGSDNPAVVAALRRRIRQAREHLVFVEYLEAVRHRRLDAVARRMLENPSDLVLLARYVTERLYLRAAWKIRRYSDLHQEGKRDQITSLWRKAVKSSG